jgi:hypothetical protein
MFRSSVVSASTPSSAHSARIAFTCSASASRAASRRSVSRLDATRHRARAVRTRRSRRARDASIRDAIDPSFVRPSVDRAVDRVGRRRTVVSLRLLGEFRLEHASLARVERHGASRRDATRRDARWRATRRRDARVFIDDGRSPRVYTA